MTQAAFRSRFQQYWVNCKDAAQRHCEESCSYRTNCVKKQGRKQGRRWGARAQRKVLGGECQGLQMHLHDYFYYGRAGAGNVPTAGHLLMEEKGEKLSSELIGMCELFSNCRVHKSPGDRGATSVDSSLSLTLGGAAGSQWVETGTLISSTVRQAHGKVRSLRLQQCPGGQPPTFLKKETV